MLVDDLNGHKAAWNCTFQIVNGSYTSSIQIPIAASADTSTTYIYRDIDVPQKAVAYLCGPRCKADVYLSAPLQLAP